MPVQLAEACMGAEFINLHLSGDGGERRRGRRRRAIRVSALFHPKQWQGRYTIK